MAAASTTVNSYQSTSDSADSPVTSPTTTQCSSPTDHLINGNIASPPNTATSNVLIMRNISTIDENSYMAFKQEPIQEVEQHTF